jgi:hypothetical protein
VILYSRTHTHLHAYTHVHTHTHTHAHTHAHADVVKMLKDKCPTCDPSSVPNSGPAPVLARFEDFKVRFLS